MAILRCDGCGGDTFESLAEPGYFRCHSCGAASSVKLVTPAGLGTFDGAGIWIAGPGSKKIQVIKVVREITGWGLKEAKDLVDASERAPQLIPVPPSFPGGPATAASSLSSAGALLSR